MTDMEALALVAKAGPNVQLQVVKNAFLWKGINLISFRNPFLFCRLWQISFHFKPRWTTICLKIQHLIEVNFVFGLKCTVNVKYPYSLTGYAGGPEKSMDVCRFLRAEDVPSCFLFECSLYATRCPIIAVKPLGGCYWRRLVYFTHLQNQMYRTANDSPLKKLSFWN